MVWGWIWCCLGVCVYGFGMLVDFGCSGFDWFASFLGSLVS